METTSPAVQAINAIVVPHTHWDREWYRPFQEFRMRLVQTVDRVLELLQTGRYPYFLLDGQTVVLADYLQIRPDREADLRTFIEAGQLGIGPWYVLMDEFLVSGEALVRNLLMGKQMMERFGSPPPRVGYLPDMFGHIAQMPQILKKFGLERAVVWRGLDSEHEHIAWQAPDGSMIPTVFLPEGYHNVILSEDKPLAERIKNVRWFFERHRSSNVLFPCGSDHLLPRPDLPDVIDQVQAKLDGSSLRIGSLEEATIHVQPAVTLQGELRYPSRAYILPDVLSTRLYLKQWNGICQNLLERYSEPLAALSWLAGDDYPSAYLREAWHLLLLNHPHDSICGCSIDEVHRENVARYLQVEQLGEGLVKRCIRQLSPRSPTPGVFIYNPSGWARSEWIRADIHWPRDKAPDAIHLVSEGEAAPSIHIIDKTDTELFIGESEKVPDWYPVRRFGVLIRVQDLPASGFAIYTAVEGAGENAEDPLLQSKFELMDLQHRMKSLERRGMKNSPQYHDMLKKQTKLEHRVIQNALPPVSVDESGLENELVHLARDGDRLLLMDKTTGHVAPDVHFFLDGGDAGDEYNWSPPASDLMVRSRLISCAPALQTPALCQWRVDFALDLPLGLQKHRESRTTETQEMRISSVFTLAADSRRFEVRTEFVNAHSDHRLRMVSGTGLSGEVGVWADSAFAVLPRRPTRQADITPLPVEKLKEYRATTFPQQTFTAVEGSGAAALNQPTHSVLSPQSSVLHGLAVAVRGLPEAEVIEHEEQWAIAVTLLRAIGWLSRGDLRTRGGQAGPHFPTVDAQCQGLQSYDYALISYSGTWLTSGIHSEALQFNAPIRCQEFGALFDFLSAARVTTADWLQVSDSRLVVSAVKRSESTEGKALVLRIYNPTPDPVEATIRLSGPFKEVYAADLRERPEDKDLGNPWTHKWRAYAIETFLVVIISA